MRQAGLAGTFVTLSAVLALTPGAPASRARSSTGTIEGSVTFDGTPPAPTLHDGGLQPVLYVDRSGGVRYAVVFLPDARPAGQAPADPAALNQRDFVFEPQVLAIRAGQRVRFTNADPANHNVRAHGSRAGNQFSINTAPGAVGPFLHRFAAAPSGRPVKLSCDIHPWMAAWVYVFEHDRFAVTGADGGFRIDNVPAGRHRVAVRQPAGGFARNLAADVRAGETTRLDVRFAPRDVGMPLR